MGIARNFAPNRAQTESLGGVIAGIHQPPVVESQRFRAATLDKQLSVIRAIRRLLELL